MFFFQAKDTPIMILKMFIEFIRSNFCASKKFNEKMVKIERENRSRMANNVMIKWVGKWRKIDKYEQIMASN